MSKHINRISGKCWSLILVSCLLTTGCMPALFLAGAATGAVILTEQRDAKTILHDMQIAPQAKALFDEAPEFRGQSSLQFHSHNQNLLITGQISSIPLQKRIDTLAKSLSRAKHVFNQTRVTPRREQHHDLKDTWITTQVKTLLVAKKDVQSTNIKIVTHDKVVYLMSSLPKSQLDIAAYIVSQMQGVKKVVEIIEKQT